MKDVIKYPVKFYLLSFVLDIFGLVWSITALVMLGAEGHIWGIVLYLLFLAVALMGLGFDLYELQWIEIEGGVIRARNIFGVVKELELAKIKKHFRIHAVAYGVKTYNKYFYCIVLSANKSLPRSSVSDAYNRKRNRYLILPDSEENRRKIKVAYIAATGKELEMDWL